MITITMNDDFTLNCDTNIIPAQHSANIPFKFEVPEEYKNSLIIPGYVYYNGCRKVESAIDNYSNGNFTLPANAFSKEGMLAIAFAITTGEETITTTTAEFEVRGSVNTSFSLPDETVWQNMLQNFMEQYIDKVYSKEIRELIDKAKEEQENVAELQTAANELITNVNSLVSDVNTKIENGDFIPNFQIGTVESGSQASATITGEKENPELNLVLPRGENGNPNALTIGNVTSGDAAEAYFTGEAPNQVLNLVLPKGDKGDKGENGGMTTHIVEALPESGESTDIYFLTVGDNYIPFMYVEGKWITFSTVQPKQLLINNSLRINQRGKSEYNFNENGKYGLDMWQHRQGNYYQSLIVVQIEGGGCHIKLGTNYGGGLRQFLDNDDFKVGENYTVVINVDGIIYKGTLDYQSSSTARQIIDNDIFKIEFGHNPDTNQTFLSLWFYNGNAEHDIFYIDLFEGNIAYPHINEDKTIELMKCQSNIIVYKEVMLPCNFSYINTDYDSISASLYLPTNFKENPNISYDSKEIRSSHGGTTYTDFSIASKRLYGTNIIRILWKKDNGVFPEMKDPYIYIKNLVISCEET